jgi:hypothetical protein
VLRTKSFSSSLCTCVRHVVINAGGYRGQRLAGARQGSSRPEGINSTVLFQPSVHQFLSEMPTRCPKISFLIQGDFCVLPREPWIYHTGRHLSRFGASLSPHRHAVDYRAEIAACILSTIAHSFLAQILWCKASNRCPEAYEPV